MTSFRRFLSWDVTNQYASLPCILNSQYFYSVTTKDVKETSSTDSCTRHYAFVSLQISHQSWASSKKKKKDPSALSLLSSTCKSVVCKLMTTLRLRCQVQSVSLLHQPQTAYWCNVVSSVHDTKLYNDGTTSQHSEKRVAAKCSHIRAASHWHMKESGVVTSCYSHFIPDYI